MGIRLDTDLSALEPGRTVVVESARRLKRELSYGFIHALWWLWLEDGRSVVSVPPGAGDQVRRIVAGVGDAKGLLDPAVADALKPAIDLALAAHGAVGTSRSFADLEFACNDSLLRLHELGDCRRLTSDLIPAAEGISLPTHCFPDGIVYGVVADDKVVSVAYAHRSGAMEDIVADLGVVTASPWRGRGFAKTAVSHAVRHVTRSGGEARYGTKPDNVGSIATARSVGFVPYGTQLALSAPAPDVRASGG